MSDALERSLPGWRAPRLRTGSSRGRYLLSGAALPAPARYRVEALDHRYLSQAAAVLHGALPESLLVALGKDFLLELVRSYLSIEGGCGFVSMRGDQVAGVVVGTVDSGRHRRLLIRRRWAPLVGSVVRGVVLSPRVAWSLAAYMRSILPLLLPHSRAVAEVPGEVSDVHPAASLVLLSVARDHRREGVAHALTSAFLEEMSRRGVSRLKAAVGAGNRAALSFFMSDGWRMAGRYHTSDGRTAYRLIRETSSLKAA